MPKRHNIYKLEQQLIADGWDSSANPFGRSYFPSKPGLYLFYRIADYCLPTQRELILYVGMSLCLANRHRAHPLWRELEPDTSAIDIVYFKERPKEVLRSEERRYIHLFDPPFNIIGRRRGLHA